MPFPSGNSFPGTGIFPGYSTIGHAKPQSGKMGVFQSLNPLHSPFSYSVGFPG